MILNRRCTVLMTQEDYDLLERLGEYHGLGATTLARTYILRGMTHDLDTLKEAEARKLRKAKR